MLGWCQYCLQTKCPPGCPNYVPPKPSGYCDVCGEGIYKGDKYLENDDGKISHYDCFDNMDDLLEWLGYDVKTMEDEYT